MTASVDTDWQTALGIAAEDGSNWSGSGSRRAAGRVPARQQLVDEGPSLKPHAERPTGPSRIPPEGDGPAPDLRSLPAFGIQIGGKGTALRFGATTWNGGNSPLVVDGFRSESDPDVMDAYQYFFDADGNQTGYTPVGEMHWHAANHNHWRFELREVHPAQLRHGDQGDVDEAVVVPGQHRRRGLHGRGR